MSQDSLQSYVTLYVKTTKEGLDNLFKSVNQLLSDYKHIDVKALEESHRISHTLKSSSLFMNFGSIAQYMLTLEHYFYDVMQKDQKLNDAILIQIAQDLEKIKNRVGQIDLHTNEIVLSRETDALKKLIKGL